MNRSEESKRQTSKAPSKDGNETSMFRTWLLLAPTTVIRSRVGSIVGANLFATPGRREIPVANKFALTSDNLVRTEIAPDRLSFGRSAKRWSSLALALLLAACGNMKRQNYLRPEEPSVHLPRGTSAQLPPAHTAPHGGELQDTAFTTGEREGKLVTTIPIPVTRELLERGRDRFDIYCAVCHGPDGYGRGIVVRRGFPAPPSYHDPRLRNVPVGHFFEVMTRGFGAMYPYADRLTPTDRWAVAAYIRALQLSQHADVRDLPDADREKLGATGGEPKRAHDANHGIEGANLFATRHAGDSRVANKFAPTFSALSSGEQPNVDLGRTLPTPPSAVRTRTAANSEAADFP